VPEIRGGDLPDTGLYDIAKVRLSGASIGPGFASERILAAAQIKSDTRFIMGVSTLEPRKNFEGLIRAWAKVRNQASPHLKLVIVGRPGWRFERILDAIRPYMLAGDLLHLQDLPAEEIRALYRRAACFVFPSFAEGFGIPPLEALQCGTPAIVSDIPTHRWVCGDAALYCDPYDANDIAEKIRHLVAADTAPALREKLLGAARQVLKRYSLDTVCGQWEELFGRLKRGERLRNGV
jgi:hypothetical protein